MNEKEYKNEVISLFKELMKMEEDGVFVSNPTFGAGKGADWLEKVYKLNKISKNLPVEYRIVSLPYGLLSNSLVISEELKSFPNLIVHRRISEYDELSSKYWLFVLLEENPNITL